MSNNRILVTGATGRQGGAVACHLLGRGFQVLALTRDPSKAAAQALAARGVEIVQGNLDDPASIRRAVEGIDGVFSVQNFSEAGVAREVEQGVSLADAAKAAGVRHFVYTSVASANRNTGLPHFESKWQIEQHLRRIGLPSTILRPVFFMQNWQTYLREPILHGTLPQPLDPQRPLQQISVDDIGGVAATAFAEPEKWIGRELDLAGDERTMPQVAGLFSGVLGRTVSYVQVPWDEFRMAAGEEMTAMYRWFNEVGYEVDIAALCREFPGLASLEQVLRSESWPAWATETEVGAGTR